jgi:PRTRC genetic system protein A
MSTNSPIVGYQLNFPAGQEPPRAKGDLYNYALAGNGVFMRASRPELEATIPIAGCEVRGLADLEPSVTLAYPRVSKGYLQRILDLSLSACVVKGSAIESLYHLFWLKDKERWRLDKPLQSATAASVRPVEDGPGSSYDRALIEVHSHHEMDAFFSGTDDADEQGFRIYGVIGNIFTEPKLRVRVGVYGNFWELPAETIFEMPDTIQDAREYDA